MDKLANLRLELCFSGLLPEYEEVKSDVVDYLKEIPLAEIKPLLDGFCDYYFGKTAADYPIDKLPRCREMSLYDFLLAVDKVEHRKKVVDTIDWVQVPCDWFDYLSMFRYWYLCWRPR